MGFADNEMIELSRIPAADRGRRKCARFQPAAKFKSRYAMLGFSDAAHLDDGGLWATYFAVTAETELRIAGLVKPAAG